VLLADDKIGVTDCDLLYESAFLNTMARFESLLNLLLEEFVCGNPTSRTGHYTLINPRSRVVFRKIMTTGRPYVELMPYQRCLEIAGRFLNDALPFKDVDPADINILRQAMYVRNAVAHRSPSAVGDFRKKVNGVLSLPPHRQYPGPYLRRMYRSHPDATWNDLYLDTVEKVGAKLAASW